MKIFTALIAAILILPACRKEELKGLPPCIRKKIQAFQWLPGANQPREVHAYVYHGRTVYAFGSACCDQLNKVYDGACNYICAPSGGFTGQGDGRCTDFAANARYVGLVWKATR